MTKLQTRTELANRLEEHFGDRLWGLFELAGNPFEPSPDSEIWTVLVLENAGYQPKQDRRTAIDIGVSVSDEVDFKYHCCVHTVSASEYEANESGWVRAARAGGVLA